MAKEPFEQFGMPKELRAFVEQSVTQAKHAFDGFIQAANQAMGQFEGQAQAARGSATRSRTNPWPMPSRTWRRRSSLPRN